MGGIGDEHWLLLEGWGEKRKLGKGLARRQNLWECFRKRYLSIIVD